MSSKCPVPYMSELHEASVNNPAVAHAVSGGTFVGLWYALPDFFRPAWLRGIVKTAMAGGAVAYLTHLQDANGSQLLPQTLEKTSKQVGRAWNRCPLSKWPPAAQTLTLVVGGIAALKLVGVIQRAIMQRGRKQKDQGKVLAHTKQGIVLGSLAGLGIYLGLRK